MRLFHLFFCVLTRTADQPGRVDEMQEAFDELDDMELSQPTASQDSFHPSQSTSSSSQPSLSQSSSMSEEASDDRLFGEKYINTPKLLVFLPLLISLFSVCHTPGCGSCVDTDMITYHWRGACLYVKAVCNNHHTFEWQSSYLIGRNRPVINYILGAYLFMNGLHVEQIWEYFAQMRISAPCKSFFYSLQTSLMHSVVWKTWRSMQDELIMELKEREEPIQVSGDGKFYSPGFRARYCTYFVQCLNNQKVIGLWCAIKFQVACSSQMETFACKTIISSLVDQFQLKIHSLTIDRCKSIRDMLASDFPWISHLFDIWHWNKSVQTELWNVSKGKKCRVLRSWMPSISNMLGWSFSTSVGDLVGLTEKILSITSHISNNHTFPGNVSHKKCSHGDLPGDRDKEWIKPGSFALKKLEAAIRGKNNCRLDDLKYMLEFTHTGGIENINSLQGKYANKHFVYEHETMVVKAALTAIDHNVNVLREQAVNKEGVPRFKMETDRGGAKWFTKVVKVPKITSRKDEIVSFVLLCVDTDCRPAIKIPLGIDPSPKNQAKVDKPSMAEAVKRHQKRL